MLDVRRIQETGRVGCGYIWARVRRLRLLRDSVLLKSATHQLSPVKGNY